METFIDFGLLVLIVMGIVEAVKRAGLWKRYVPVLSIVLGIAAALVVGFGSGELATGEVIMQGIIIGLSACGLWSGTKTFIKG